MAITSVSSDIIDQCVTDLVGWLDGACDNFLDGDFDAENLERLADIIRKIPSKVEVPDEIWTY
jgi:hypothetical protein